MIARLETSPLWGMGGGGGRGRAARQKSAPTTRGASLGRVEIRASAHLVVELLEHDVDHLLLHVRGGAEGVLGELGEEIGGGHVPKVCGEGSGGRGRSGQIRARGGKPCCVT